MKCIHPTCLVFAKILIFFDKQMKNWNNYALILCIICLLVICFISVYSSSKPETPAEEENIETIVNDSIANDTATYHQNK